MADNKENFMLVDESNLFLVKSHLREKEIDEGRNAYFDEESGVYKYFFNKDDSGEKRNAQFCFSGDKFFLKYFAPDGTEIHMDWPVEEEKDELASQLFLFTMYNFRTFCPSTIADDFKNYSNGLRQMSKGNLVVWGYPALRLVEWLSYSADKRTIFSLIRDKTIPVVDRNGQALDIYKVTPDFEKMIKESFDDFYHDRYGLLDPSPLKKSKNQVLNNMISDLEKMINYHPENKKPLNLKEAVTCQKETLNLTDLWYFFQIAGIQNNAYLNKLYLEELLQKKLKK